VLDEQQDAFDDDERCWLDVTAKLQPRVRLEVVHRHVDRLTRPQRSQVLHQQRGL